MKCSFVVRGFPQNIKHPLQQGAFPPAVFAGCPPKCILRKAWGEAIKSVLHQQILPNSSGSREILHCTERKGKGGTPICVTPPTNKLSKRKTILATTNGHKRINVTRTLLRFQSVSSSHTSDINKGDNYYNDLFAFFFAGEFVRACKSL